MRGPKTFEKPTHNMEPGDSVKLGTDTHLVSYRFPEAPQGKTRYYISPGAKKLFVLTVLSDGWVLTPAGQASKEKYL